MLHWAVFLKNKVLRRSSGDKHHIYYSIWNGIRLQFQTLLSNTQILDRTLVMVIALTFGLISEVGSLVDFYNLLQHISLKLQSKVEDYIISCGFLFMQ